MKVVNRLMGYCLLVVALLGLAGCDDQEPITAVTAVPPTPTSPVAPTVGAARPTNQNFLVIATDAPNPPFTEFDQFGDVKGFIADFMRNMAAVAGFDYEFVVTPHDGALESIGQDFDAVMSNLVIPESPPDGIAYTIPYLEVGQVLVVLADERDLQTHHDIQAGMRIGVQTRSSGEVTARTLPGAIEVVEYDTVTEALEALVREELNGVILDSYNARAFTEMYPEQLKIAGGPEQDAWMSRKAYGIAVSADNQTLLARLNEAIAQTQANLAGNDMVLNWLVPDTVIDAGESRVSTQGDELVIGMIGQLTDMDPTGPPDLIGWEVKSNTMSGLFRLNAANELEPLLAADFPTISEDKLTYTFRLRAGLQFPDGSDLTADDVKWSIERATRLGSFSYLVNAYLKDSDDNGFADNDAILVLDPLTVQIRLQRPTPYFLSLLATPPYFVISSTCFPETQEPLSACGGIGPYTIVNWTPGERMRLRANPNWPGEPAPAFANILLRFFESTADVRRSLEEFQSIDVAWTGLPYNDFVALRQQDVNGDGAPDFTAWEGPTIFKSYLIFDQATPPWDSKKVRQAAAYAIDRIALARDIFAHGRLPLYSPIPDSVFGHFPALPERNLAQARSLLLEEGYSQNNPLAITLWYVGDGRYSPVEDAYAEAIKSQLEETGVFQVTLSSAPWEVYQTQIYSCNYPAYLIGWPSPGRPTEYLDATSWTEFFVQNTDRNFCSNYESEAMDRLLATANEELDPAARQEIYVQIQQLWADELPTLDLTQEPRRALALNTIGGISIDAMGFLHYELLTKEGE
jgi:peptide/nickel transport system substrate-binding protein